MKEWKDLHRGATPTHLAVIPFISVIPFVFALSFVFVFCSTQQDCLRTVGFIRYGTTRSEQVLL